ncbi:MAG: hypothetical protein ACOCXS_03440 [Bacteroidota bacterium]
MNEPIIETIEDNEFVLVTYDKLLRIVAIIWRGAVTSEQYRKSYITGLDFAKRNQVDGFLSDISKQQLLEPTDRNWFETDILPYAVELGIKRGCVVYDGNIFKEYYLTRILNKIKTYSIPFRFFKSRKSAYDWLLSAEIM